jgi:rapamycin-insensitive companion of mTOR
VYRRSRVTLESREGALASERPHETLKLTDQYIALLVLVFTNVGLLDVSTFILLHFHSAADKLLQALTAMIEEETTGSNLSRKATLLMAEVLQMANRVLPLSVAANLQVSISHIMTWSRHNHGVRLFLAYLISPRIIPRANIE